MLEILLPRTDAGVAVQAVFAAVVLVILGVAARRHPDFRIFVAGLTLMTIAFFGVRMIH